MSVNFQNENESPKFQIKKYIDIDMDFGLNPFTKDIMMKKGDASIKQSVKNLVLGRLGERPFQPRLGSGVRALLFENMTPVTETLLQDKIEETIRVYEPRAQLISVMVNGDVDRNEYLVTITFRVINLSPAPITITEFLQRLR